MTNEIRHAKTCDLPGWPCPPRVRDIPNKANSWGLIPMRVGAAASIAQDEMGYLWINGDVTPQFDIPNETNANPGALVFWTQSGIGLWVHPNSLRFLPSISRLDMQPDQWLPVNEVSANWPEFIDRPQR